MLQKPETFMVVAAHPDDMEMSCGATVRKLVAGGARGHLLLLTNGECGGRRTGLSSAELAAARQQEQLEAAKVLGIENVLFLGEPDGGVEYSAALRASIVRWLRTWKPDLILTHDPRTLLLPWNEINHRDHRITGELVLDAVYPYARGRLLYPEQIAEGLTPHVTKDVLMWDTDTPNHFEDVTEFMADRVTAVACHKSQFPKIEPVSKWLYQHAEKTATKLEMKHAERFHHIDLRPPF